MKRTLLIICTLLCANVLLAQTTFTIGDLTYGVISTNPPQVEVHDANLSITTANIPETVTYNETTYSVTSIGDDAFSFCSSLISVTIGNGVTSIGAMAFNGCSSLISVTIGNGVTSIGVMAFNGCSSLTSIDIPNSVTSIRIGAFVNCSSLTSITIPESVTIIGGFLFEGCINLGTVNYNPINCSLDSSIWVSPFLYSAINTINIGNSVQIIPDDFASSADSLTCVNFEDNSSVTSIGGRAFADCSSLTSVTIPNSVTSIYDFTFSGCSSLTSVDIPNSVTSIGISAFSRCSSLTSVTIPNSVTSIGEKAFKNCSSLTSVTFGESLAEIEAEAFATSSLLQNITCLGTNPPILYNNSFPYPNIATVTVPCGSLEAYSAPTSFWNMLFTDRIEEDCSGLIDIEETEISLYPNPTNSKVTFNQAIERIELIDLAGKTLRTYENESEINIEQLPAGVYYLRLTNNEKQTLRKLIKE